MLQCVLQCVLQCDAGCAAVCVADCVATLLSLSFPSPSPPLSLSPSLSLCPPLSILLSSVCLPLPPLYLSMWCLRLVGSLKLQVSFAEYSLFYRALLQKRLKTLRSRRIVATPYLSICLSISLSLRLFDGGRERAGEKIGLPPSFLSLSLSVPTCQPVSL